MKVLAKIFELNQSGLFEWYKVYYSNNFKYPIFLSPSFLYLLINKKDSI